MVWRRTLTVRRKSLHRACRAESASVGDAHDCDKNNGIEDRWEDLDASELDSDDEGGVKRTGASTAIQCLVVDGHNQANQSKVHNVEEKDTVDDLLRGLGDLLPWVFRLSCRQAGKLGASVCECCVDENATEAMEAVAESCGGHTRNVATDSQWTVL
jgi:hypothetical protein